MPTIHTLDNQRVTHKQNGWVETTVADKSIFGETAMVVRRWSFDPTARCPTLTRGEEEMLVYVISGNGKAILKDDQFILEEETVLWLEPGDIWYLQAGETGLEVLVGHAPGN